MQSPPSPAETTPLREFVKRIEPKRIRLRIRQQFADFETVEELVAAIIASEHPPLEFLLRRRHIGHVTARPLLAALEPYLEVARNA